MPLSTLRYLVWPPGAAQEASWDILIFLALIWTQNQPPTALPIWLIILELIWSKAPVWCWRVYLAEVTECLQLPCPASLWTALPCSTRPWRSLKQERRGWRQKLDIEGKGVSGGAELAKDKKKKKYFSPFKVHKGRSWVCESEGFCEHVFTSKGIRQCMHLSISLCGVAAGNFASVFLT